MISFFRSTFLLYFLIKFFGIDDEAFMKAFADNIDTII